MLRSLKLINFRAFKNYSISFEDSAYLVGPNNAGKSTILMALRIVDVLLKSAFSHNTTLVVQDGLEWYRAYPVSLVEFPSLYESIHYEFMDDDARLELRWENGCKLVAVWPRSSDTDRSPFFYLTTKKGQMVSSKQIQGIFTRPGVIPVLSPLEHTEIQLSEKYVKDNYSTRLSSRHFRNQLRLLQEAGLYDKYREFAQTWLDDIELLKLDHHLGDKGVILDLYYQELASRVPKEIIWSGDGIQIWLQLLFHIFRLGNAETIVLDEPDVYLHPDLQRKLVRLVDGLGKQVIMTSHSSEVISEAPTTGIILIEKTRKRAIRLADEANLGEISQTLGSSFNLRLAKALRAKDVLFVEGDDMAILRRIAVTLGLSRLANERGIAIVPIGGYSHKDKIEPFKWLADNVLSNAFKIHAILDRDYRSDEEIKELEARFRQQGIDLHVWHKKEVESYLLNPSTIARLRGISVEEANKLLMNASDGMFAGVYSKMQFEVSQRRKGAKDHVVSVSEALLQEFSSSWKDLEYRLKTCPAKSLLSELNRLLASSGLKPLSAGYIAANIVSDEIPLEVKEVLREINDESN